MVTVVDSTHPTRMLSCCNGAFPLPDSDFYSDPYTNSYEMNKGSTATDSDGDSDGNSYGQLL